MINSIDADSLTQRNSLKLITAPVCVLISLCFISSAGYSQQSLTNNLAPVEKICLLGQGCVGTIAGSTRVSETSSPMVGMEDGTEVTQPSSPTVAAASFDAEASYLANCMACHTTGAAGAPKLSDKADWEARMSKGMDAVMANVINGFSVMPARGLCMSCSDEELQSIVSYMLEQ